jgi:hypothetical protein
LDAPFRIDAIGLAGSGGGLTLPLVGLALNVLDMQTSRLKMRLFWEMSRAARRASSASCASETESERDRVRAREGPAEDAVPPLRDRGASAVGEVDREDGRESSPEPGEFGNTFERSSAHCSGSFDLNLERKRP